MISDLRNVEKTTAAKEETFFQLLLKDLGPRAGHSGMRSKISRKWISHMDAAPFNAHSKGKWLSMDGQKEKKTGCHLHMRAKLKKKKTAFSIFCTALGGRVHPSFFLCQAIRGGFIYLFIQVDSAGALYLINGRVCCRWGMLGRIKGSFSGQT